MKVPIFEGMPEESLEQAERELEKRIGALRELNGFVLISLTHVLDIA